MSNKDSKFYDYFIYALDNCFVIVRHGDDGYRQDFWVKKKRFLKTMWGGNYRTDGKKDYSFIKISSVESVLRIIRELVKSGQITPHQFEGLKHEAFGLKSMFEKEKNQEGGIQIVQIE